MNPDEFESFFISNPAPEDFPEAHKKIEAFCRSQEAVGRPMVLVTSGGTTIPLEVNTVRFVDNFSAGTRGSASAEYFLKAGFAVVFLFREKSLQPFSRKVNTNSLLQNLVVESDSVRIVGAEAERLRTVVEDAQKHNEMLCRVSFTSLTSYLWLLKATSQALPRQSILYLAAAVSDFYIPSLQLPVHKLQSSAGPDLTLQLQLVPKMLQPLVKSWAKQCFVVSFKLETDPDLLISKSRAALTKYGHSLVVGNLLNTRAREVVLITKDKVDQGQKLVLEQAEVDQKCEIEQKIVGRIVDMHNTKSWLEN